MGVTETEVVPPATTLVSCGEQNSSYFRFGFAPGISPYGLFAAGMLWYGAYRSTFRAFQRRRITL